MKWTLGSLLRECLRVLNDEHTILVTKTMPEQKYSASVIWTDGYCHIAYDPSQDGSIRAVIHELLHVVLDREFEKLFDTESEEWVLSGGLEEGLYKKIMKSPYLAKRWRLAIERKTK